MGLDILNSILGKLGPLFNAGTGGMNLLGQGSNLAQNWWARDLTRQRWDDPVLQALQQNTLNRINEAPYGPYGDPYTQWGEPFGDMASSELGYMMGHSPAAAALGVLGQGVNAPQPGMTSFADAFSGNPQNVPSYTQNTITMPDVQFTRGPQYSQTSPRPGYAPPGPPSVPSTPSTPTPPPESLGNRLGQRIEDAGETWQNRQTPLRDWWQNRQFTPLQDWRNQRQERKSYALGTPYVPRTGQATLHRGEAVVPKAMNPWAARGGPTQGVQPGQPYRQAGSLPAPAPPKPLKPQAPAAQPLKAQAPAPLKQPTKTSAGAQGIMDQMLGAQPIWDLIDQARDPAALAGDETAGPRTEAQARADELARALAGDETAGQWGQPTPPMNSGSIPPPEQPYDINQGRVDLLAQILQNPDAISPEIQRLMYQGIADKAALGEQDAIRQLQETMGARGLGDSGIQSDQIRRVLMGTERNLGEAQRDIGIAAAETNWQSRMDAMNAALGHQLGMGQATLDWQQFANQLGQQDWQRQYDTGEAIANWGGRQQQMQMQVLGLAGQLTESGIGYSQEMERWLFDTIAMSYLPPGADSQRAWQFYQEQRNPENETDWAALGGDIAMSVAMFAA